MTTPPSRLRAVLELLRAPLLLSPVADVVAGACWLAGDAALADPRVWVGAAVGICLLAAGMAQNARADLDDDRRRKPLRPLPRGDVALTQALAIQYVLTLNALALAAWLGPAPLAVAGSIVLVSWAYHYPLAGHRTAGCLALGTTRALDLGLGVAIVASGADGVSLALLERGAGLAAIYGLYVLGASLHASTDDAPGAERRSTVGVGGAVSALGLLALLAWTRAPTALDASFATVFAVLAAARILAARARVPPPALTGVLLSGLPLFAATAAVAAAAPFGAAVAIAAFACSRILLRSFPPT